MFTLHIHLHAIHGCLSLTRPTPLSTSQPSSCLSSSSPSSTSATSSSRSSTRRSWKTCATPPTTGGEGTYDVLYLPTHPELVKSGRFDLSTITSWQRSTIKRVVRSTLAAEGYAVSEGHGSAQWFRHLLTEAQLARSSLKDVEKESLKRPALVFTDSDSLANTAKKDVGQGHDNRFRHVVSMLREGFQAVENMSLQWLPTHKQVAYPLTKTMERDILVSFFNSRAFQSVAKKVYASRTATESV